MLFNSPLFLFVFLPVTLCLFYFQAWRGNYKSALASLVLCSLVFYAAWKPPYLLLLLFSIAVNFKIGSAIIHQEPHSRKAKSWLYAGVVFNLALIGYFKYANFFVSIADDLSGQALHLEQIILPLGISFFTFQQITWLVDTYKGNSKQYELLEYTQFVTFFPQLIAGPIVHHHEMMPQFSAQTMLSKISDNFSIGLTLFIFGLFKKVVLADSIALHANPVFEAAELGVQLSVYEAWMGAIAYSLQLYFDFSGYSDMAIGLARMFGITLPINFFSPYKARSIIDFWRRWHMTLSRFLRDYLYIPLGGSRRGPARRYVNVALTMLLGGLWHGAGWTFIIWGALHGAFLAINHAWRALPQRRSESLLTAITADSTDSLATPSKKENWITGAFFHSLTLVCVVTAWVVFRAESLTAAISQIRSMFGFNGIALPFQLQTLIEKVPLLGSMPSITFGKLFGNGVIDPGSALAWIASLSALALAAPNTQQLLRRYRPVLETVQTPTGLFRRVLWTPSICWLLIVATALLYTALHLSNISEFLYFQF